MSTQGEQAKSVVPEAEYSADVKLPAGRRLLFSFNDLGATFSAFFVSAFLIPFFTNVVLIPMAAISLMVLITRIFDAVTDPVVGAMLDKSNRKNRYQPWVLSGSILMIATVVILYFNNPTWSETTRIVYLWVFYILWTVFMTIRNMSFNALSGVTTTNGMERAKLSSFRGMMTGLGAAAPGVLAVPMIMFFSMGDGMDRRGYIVTMLIFSAIALPLVIASPLALPERAKKPVGQKISVKEQIVSLVKNPPMRYCIVGAFMFGLLIFGRVNFIFHFTQYNLGNAAWFSILSFVNIVASLVGAACVPYLFKWLKNKGHVCSLGLLVAGAGSLAAFFFHGGSIVLTSIFFTFVCFGATIFSAMDMAIIGDSSDYAELNYGVRVDGFFSASFSMSQKIGAAISPAVGAAMLATAGFISGAETQTAEVMQIISFNVWAFPAIFCFVSGVIFLFYKLDDAKHKEIVAQLEERRRVRAMSENAPS